MHWNCNANRRRPQMRHMAEKLHRAFLIAAFQFAVRWAHAAQRPNAALDAFRHFRTLALAYPQKRAFPNLLQTGLANSERLLLRDHADANLSICIDSERIDPTAAGVNAVIGP